MLSAAQAVPANEIAKTTRAAICHRPAIPRLRTFTFRFISILLFEDSHHSLAASRETAPIFKDQPLFDRHYPRRSLKGLSILQCHRGRGRARNRGKSDLTVPAGSSRKRPAQRHRKARTPLKR